MCGRFTKHYTWEQVHAFLDVFGSPRNLQPRYNVAPTTMIDAVRLTEQGRELVPMRWGLVPYWWQKFRKPPSTFNARAETVATNPTFRDAFRHRHCIIPASGFYEWTASPWQARQPHLFTAADGSPILAFAGLWDRWRDPERDEWLLSCTIIVCDASAWMEKYHERMPVILPPERFAGWLNGSIRVAALTCAPEDMLREWPVSRRLNRSSEGDDDPSIILATNEGPQTDL